jgi:glycylpeptide N-tetradecanoyltransferase
VNTYVLEGENGEITDMLSYYYLNSSIINNPDYKTLCAVYSFYNVANTVDMVELMNNSLILAKKNGADVFNCLELMENQKVFTKLKFGPGDGRLQYYLYNWRAPHIECPKVGLVLL